jgi:pSer/pThr/pTyr-binding forkhead associated (FHA) protein
MPRVIITVQDKNPQPYRFQLDRKVVSLGRGSDNDIVIDSGSVSGRHAEMHRVEGGYELADLGSTNGIKYDGTRQQVIPLRSGMSVKLGDVAFDFTLSEEELEALAREKPVQESPIMKEEEIPEMEIPGVSHPVGESRRAETATPAMSTGARLAMILLFLFLASAAFYAGLAIRHQKDTGESLLKGIVNKSNPAEAVPVDGVDAE